MSATGGMLMEKVGVTVGRKQLTSIRGMHLGEARTHERSQGGGEYKVTGKL